VSKVVSIICAGHSGSTLLDCVIGSIPGAFSTGELTYLPWQIGRSAGHPSAVSAEEARVTEDVCSCLRSFRTCEAWSAVIARLSEKVGFDIYQDPYRFNMAILRNAGYTRPNNKRWKNLLTAPWPRWLTNLAIQHRPLRFVRDLAQAYVRAPVENNWLLFDTMHEVLGAEYVVDSTKDFLRFLMLHSFRPEDIRMTLLIRDIRGVTFSSVKRGLDPLAWAKLWLRYHNRIMTALRENKDVKWEIVLYENLVEHPLEVRKRLANFLDLPDPGDDLRINTRERHLVAGNPIKYQGEITIRHDDTWRTGLDPEVRRQVDTIAEGLDQSLRELIDRARAEYAIR
jgi:hypothetical protein